MSTCICVVRECQWGIQGDPFIKIQTLIIKFSHQISSKQASDIPPPPGKQNYPQLILKKIPLDPLQWAILLKGFSYFSGHKRVTDTRSFWYQLTQLGNGRHVASGGGCYFPFLATNIFEFLKFTKLIENIILRSPPSSKKQQQTNHILGKCIKNVCVFVCVLCNILPKSKCITKTLNLDNTCPYCI